MELKYHILDQSELTKSYTRKADCTQQIIRYYVFHNLSMVFISAYIRYLVDLSP